MVINTISQRQSDTQEIIIYQQQKPKRTLKSKWIYLGGERVCQWVVVEQ